MLFARNGSEAAFPGLSLGTPGTFGAKSTHLATKYDEERIAFLDSTFPTEARVIKLWIANVWCKQTHGSIGFNPSAEKINFIVWSEWFQRYVFMPSTRLQYLKWFLREEITSKGAKIMKILSPEWSPIARWDLALSSYKKVFRTLNIQICFCISWVLRNALAGPETSSRARFCSVWQWRGIVVYVLLHD